MVALALPSGFGTRWSKNLRKLRRPNVTPQRGVGLKVQADFYPQIVETFRVIHQRANENLGAHLRRFEVEHKDLGISITEEEIYRAAPELVDVILLGLGSYVCAEPGDVPDGELLAQQASGVLGQEVLAEVRTKLEEALEYVEAALGGLISSMLAGELGVAVAVEAVALIFSTLTSTLASIGPIGAALAPIAIALSIAILGPLPAGVECYEIFEFSPTDLSPDGLAFARDLRAHGASRSMAFKTLLFSIGRQSDWHGQMLVEAFVRNWLKRHPGLPYEVWYSQTVLGEEIGHNLNVDPSSAFYEGDHLVAGLPGITPDWLDQLPMQARRYALGLQAGLSQKETEKWA